MAEPIKTIFEIEAEHDHAQKMAQLNIDLVNASLAPTRRLGYILLIARLMSVSAGLSVLLIMAHYHLSYWMVLVAILFLAVSAPSNSTAPSQENTHEDR